MNLPKPPLVWAIPGSSTNKVAHLVGSPDIYGLTFRACKPEPPISRAFAEVTLTPKGGLCKICSKILVTLKHEEIAGESS